MRILRRLGAASAALSVVLLGLGLVVVPSGTANAASTTFAPVADSYVRADQPTTNFGTSAQLNVRAATPLYTSYLQFNVTGLTAPPMMATLKLFNRTSGATSVKAASVSDNTWTEGGLNYNNRPALGSVTTATGALTAGTWASVDVTAWVQTNGLVSFGLSTGATAVRTFDSREGANPPQLVLTPAPPSNGDPVVMAGGDIACSASDPNFNGGSGAPGYCHMGTTANLISGQNPAAVLALGDEQYNSGSPSDFAASYDPSWGAFKTATHPVVGNHEYGTSGAGGYFGYFGDASTPLQPGCRSACEGYYSFNIGTWHIAVINTECTRIDGGAGCAAGSPQDLWLQSDLAASTATCTMVLGHRPYWSSNSFASADIAPLIDDMYQAGVDLYVPGHSHSYERFAAQNPSGGADPAGITEIVAGTGGSFFTGFGTIVPNSVVHQSQIFGALKLTLHPGNWDWQFLPDPSTPFSDAGTGTCH